jgi:peptide/nickel transport system permease protein
LTYLGAENRSGYSSTNGPSNDSVLWFRADSPSQVPIRSSQLVNASRVYVSDTFGHIYALNRLMNGSTIWTQNVGSTPTTADLSASGLIMGESDGVVTALDPNSGAFLWNTTIGGPVFSGIAVANSTIVVTAGVSVVGLNLSNGQLQWRIALSSPTTGPVAIENGRVFVTGSSGTVWALSLSGSVLWTRSLGAPVGVAPTVAFGAVVIADGRTNVTALDQRTGAVLWQWNGPAQGARGGFNATPAIGNGRVFVQTNLAQVWAISITNGTTLWRHDLSAYYTGNTVFVSPVVTPTGLYVVASAYAVLELSPSTGAPLWPHPDLLTGFAFSSPAVDRGDLFLTTSLGEIRALGPPPVIVNYPVQGRVINTTGAPVAGVAVQAGAMTVFTDTSGQFALQLSNGSYVLTASIVGYAPSQMTISVQGPLAGIQLTIRPVFFYPLTGVVEDSRSGHRLVGVFVTVSGPYGTSASAQTLANGSFSMRAPEGADLLVLSDPPNYHSSFQSLRVAGGAVLGLVLTLDPVGLTTGSSRPNLLVVSLPILALMAALLVYAGYYRIRRRTELGLPSTVLSSLARFVLMRLILIPAQVVAILLVLYVFGTFLPAAALGTNLCALTSGACSSCSWSNLLCIANAFGQGFGRFVFDLFTGAWGTAVYSNFSAPAAQFLVWWLPDSLELAVVALLLSAVIAYPIGLLAGWRRERTFDTSVRLSSLVGLLLPSFLLAVIILGVSTLGFNATFGDIPFGTLPTLQWFQTHGGIPSWVGVGYTTGPTSFPLVDGFLHRAWAFEAVVAAKTLIQAAAVAVIYVAIFLRYARHAAAEAAAEPNVIASKARGVSDPEILWRHLGRRIRPLYLLIFGLTLPMYIGTQALVEAVPNANGVGTLFLAEITNFSRSGFGVHSQPGGTVLIGNFYQVLIFLLLVLVLLGNLLTDILARYYDPRLIQREKE